MCECTIQVVTINCDHLSKNYPCSHIYKLKFILLPQLIATPNNHACPLPTLANVDLFCFSRVLFVDYVNPCLMKLCQRRSQIWLWGPDMATTVSAHLSRPSGSILALCTCTRHSYSKLYFCVILLLCLSFCHHHPHPWDTPTHLLTYS